MRSGSSRFSGRPEAAGNGVPAADRRARVGLTVYTLVTNSPSTISLRSAVPLPVGLNGGDYETGRIRLDY